MSARTFLDTNVLVYLFDSRDPSKQERASHILESEEPSPFVVSAQVLGEFYVTVTQKLPTPLDSISARAAVDWISEYIVISTDVFLVRRAMGTAEAAQLSYWDALIIEAAVSAGCDRILTEDLTSGSVILGLRVENPFAA